jgi:diguanylate cyclase
VSTKLVAALQLGKAGQKADHKSEADAFRRMLADAFRTLSDVLASGDTGTLTDVIAAVEQCRTETEAGAAAHLLSPLATACFESTRNTAAHARNRAAEQRAQVTAVVTMVRETVATLAGDQASLHDSLTDSAQRFERIAHIDDLQKIQAQLVKEVATLKRVTIERRAAWDQTVQEFGTRLNTLESQLDRTRREAATDPLTNIANRRVFEGTCREWLGPNRPGFVMAMIDVDDFKTINDRYGHAIGDRVLSAIAETLSCSLRSGDLVARLGGDEFAILAACLTLSQAEGRCASIGRAVQNACGSIVPEGPAPSISIGVTECAAGDTVESLQQRADAALYDAKRNGKGRVASKASPFIRDLWKTR